MVEVAGTAAGRVPEGYSGGVNGRVQRCTEVSCRVGSFLRSAWVYAETLAKGAERLIRLLVRRPHGQHQNVSSIHVYFHLGHRSNDVILWIRVAPRAGWTIVDRLHSIKANTLVINGAADMAQDFVIQPFVDNIPNATHVRFEHSSHTPFWEEREAYMRVVSQFLDS